MKIKDICKTKFDLSLNLYRVAIYILNIRVLGKKIRLIVYIEKVLNYSRNQ